MTKKYRMTSFSKLLLVLVVVGSLTYIYLEFGNELMINSIQTKASTFKDTYITYIHNMPNGNLALRNRELTNQEYKNIKKNKTLNESTYIMELPNNTPVLMLIDNENSYYIQVKGGKKGFISKRFAGELTLKKVD